MNNISRRNLLATGTAFCVVGSAFPSLALNKSGSQDFVLSLVKEVQAVIDANLPETKMFSEFEDIFGRYADVPLIARKALGPAYRAANSAQQKAYISSFRGYMARFYGKRFEEFIGAEINVTKAVKAPGGFLVDTQVKLRGQSPFLTQWQVIESRGQTKMFNLFIEGVSVLSDVRTQISAMLEKRGGDVDRLTQHLRTAG